MAKMDIAQIKKDAVDKKVELQGFLTTSTKYPLKDAYDLLLPIHRVWQNRVFVSKRMKIYPSP